MYAIFAHGGKQYRVSPGETLRIERVEAEVGQELELAPVLLVSNDGDLRFGGAVAGTKVVATVLRQARAPKILIFKKKRRKQYRRTQGHRQHFTEVRVERIA